MTLTDLETRTEAAFASTGEQKTLLTGVILCHARLIADARGFAPLLLLDEPSLGLAPVIQDVVYAALAKLRQKERMPMLLVEQNANRALDLCSRAYVLELGSITRSADSLTLRNNPAIQAAYLGG